MRFLTLMIAVMALLTVTYIRLKAPSYAAVFGDDKAVAELDARQIAPPQGQSVDGRTLP